MSAVNPWSCSHPQLFTAREGDEYVVRCQHCMTEIDREPFVEDGRLYGTPDDAPESTNPEQNQEQND